MNKITSGYNILIKALQLLMIFSTAIVFKAGATHLRAGDITVQRVQGNTYTITLRVYTKTLGQGTNVPFSHDNSGVLNFGDGTHINLQQEDGTVTEFDNGKISVIIVTVQHTYTGNGKFVISYIEANRNEGVLNMEESIQTPFYIETQITLDPFYPDAHSPQLSVPPIDKGCIGVTWFHNPGAFDLDPQDSVSYAPVVPFMDRQTTVVGYQDPAAIGHGKTEDGTKDAFYKIDPKSGLITWDSPKVAGEYNIAFIVIEWHRKPDGTFVKLGFVRRDMQIIIVDECNDKRPDLLVPDNICVEAGTSIDEAIIASDPDAGDKVKVEAFSSIIDSDLNNVPIPPAAKFTMPTPPDANGYWPNPVTGHFTWNTTCNHIRERAYDVVFKVTDNNALHLAAFKSFSIKVVAPAPKWDDTNPITLVPSKRSAKLLWKNYICNTQAEAMQIWRRIDKMNYTKEECITGMPDLGYQLIATVPLKDASGGAVTTYTDKGLAPGAFYCYRMVAIFPFDKTGGAKSYLSDEQCTGPFEIDAPVITKVSVDTTSSTKGKISVAWVVEAGSQADNYKVYRGDGPSGAVSPAPVYTGTALEFVDNSLNTADNVYHYLVISFRADNSSLDTSAMASSVRLEPQTQTGKILLNWSATVPWSNNADPQLMHLIYRGPENSKENDLVLIDSVDAVSNGFHYTDNGPLDANNTYCYRVMTRGKYGYNAASPIKFPTLPTVLKNYSEIICAQPGDSVPPCKPNTPIRIEFTDCEHIDQSSCDLNLFINKLTWNKANDPACAKDTYAYQIYYSNHVGDSFTELLDANLKPIIITDTFYIDTLSQSFARCYKIKAIDRSGNSSEFSDPVCIENCPHYELPNVFTPNNDTCDDLFSAFGKKDKTGETTLVECASLDITTFQLKCARFVESVVFRVYNRWGNEVFNYAFDANRNSTDDGTKTIYIDWDGRDNLGHELSQGVYYYVAEVTFIVVDPSKKHKTIKGWVQLLR